MNGASDESSAPDVAPGFMDAARRSVQEGLQTYLIGLALSAALTAAAFYLAESPLIWRPAIPVALSVLAVAQIGVHLVFFLHLTTAPDNVNNALALAFGTLIVTLVIGGSLWIMRHLNENMLPMRRMAPAQLVQSSGAWVAQGVIESARAASVEARAAGVIQSVHCDVGMHVKAGQLCAKIDPRPYRTAMNRSESGRRAAEARLRQDAARLASAQTVLERSEAHPPRRGINRKAIEAARRSVDQAQARMSRDRSKLIGLETDLRAAKAKLAESDILAPIDGVVKSRDVRPGQEVGPHVRRALFVFTPDSASVNVKAAVRGEDLQAIKPSDKTTFAVEGLPNMVFSGSVTRVAPSQNAGSVDVVITAPNPDALLKPGMTATISINPH